MATFTNRHDPIAAAAYRAVDQGSVTRELVGLAGLADTTEDQSYRIPGWVTEGASDSAIAHAAVALPCGCRKPWGLIIGAGVLGYLLGR